MLNQKVSNIVCTQDNFFYEMAWFLFSNMKTQTFSSLLKNMTEVKNK